MKAQAHFTRWLVIRLAALAIGATVAIAAATSITAAAVRADQLGLNGTPALVLLLLGLAGGLLALVGLIVAATNYAKWRIAVREAPVPVWLEPRQEGPAHAASASSSLLLA